MADFDPLWFRIIAGTMVGLVMGSFATVISWRLPRAESLVHPPSHCPICTQRLRVSDLIPVVSWLLSKGKCRHCNSPISIKYPVIELASATICAFAWCWLGFGIPLALVILALPWVVAGIAFIICKGQSKKL